MDTIRQSARVFVRRSLGEPLASPKRPMRSRPLGESPQKNDAPNTPRLRVRTRTAYTEGIVCSPRATTRPRGHDGRPPACRPRIRGPKSEPLAYRTLRPGHNERDDFSNYWLFHLLWFVKPCEPDSRRWSRNARHRARRVPDTRSSGAGGPVSRPAVVSRATFALHCHGICDTTRPFRKQLAPSQVKQLRIRAANVWPTSY